MPDNMRVVIDTNIALDLVLNREPFVLDALQIFALAEARYAELLLSTDAISTLCYIVAKNQGRAAAREAATKLLDFVTLAALDERSVVHGLAYDFEDIEDALVAAVAEKERAQAIVTRNKKDFKNSPVPALNPREFLALWAARTEAQAQAKGDAEACDKGEA